MLTPEKPIKNWPSILNPLSSKHLELCRILRILHAQQLFIRPSLRFISTSTYLFHTWTFRFSTSKTWCPITTAARWSPASPSHPASAGSSSARLLTIPTWTALRSSSSPSSPSAYAQCYSRLHHTSRSGGSLLHWLAKPISMIWCTKFRVYQRHLDNNWPLILPRMQCHF